MPDIVIIGAGLTGLSCAFHLKRPFLLLEKAPAPGGLCGSLSDGGFTTDYSGHFLHLHTPYAKALFSRLMGDRLAEIRRSAWIRVCGRTIPYPFQANLRGLPDEVKRECLEGFLHNPYAAAPVREGMSFLDWSCAVFGPGITTHFMKPYNEKLWTVSARRMTADWAAPFVPRPSAGEIRAGAARGQKKSFGYNARFLYPCEGGSRAIVDAFAAGVPGIRTGVAAEGIDVRSRCVETSEGERRHFDALVSTQPLPALLDSMGRLPSPVAEARSRLAWNSVLCLNVAVPADAAGKEARGRHWMYFPEKEYPFYRVGFYTNVAPSMAPEGFLTMYIEISHRPGRVPPVAAAFAGAVDGLYRAGIVRTGAPVELLNALPMPYAYVIYDRRRTAALAEIRAFLRRYRISSIGRYGAWEYSFMERSVIQGKETAEALDGGEAGSR